MPRYRYDKLTVATLHSVDYPPTELREAVEHLKTLDQRGFTGLTAETSARAGQYRLLARPFLKLDQIIGRTPRDVWEMFDADVDKQRKSLLARDKMSYAAPTGPIWRRTA